jgi:hypothetical protein
MPTIIDARNSHAIRRMQQEVPVLRASSLGDEAFIGFITDQACKPSGAALVVSELEGRVKAGFRLDHILTQVLKMARATVARQPALATAFH